MEVFLQDTLQSFLQDNHTCPRLAYTLLEALSSELDDDSFPEFENRHGAEYRPPLHQLQAWARWPQLFQGCLVVYEWSQLQKAFLANLPLHQQPDRKYYMGNSETSFPPVRAGHYEHNGTIETQTVMVARKSRRATLSSTSVSWTKSTNQQYARGSSMLVAADRDIMISPNPSFAKPHTAQPAALKTTLAQTTQRPYRETQHHMQPPLPPL